jgi:hypothetical protein
MRMYHIQTWHLQCDGPFRTWGTTSIVVLHPIDRPGKADRAADRATSIGFTGDRQHLLSATRLTLLRRSGAWGLAFRSLHADCSPRMMGAKVSCSETASSEIADLAAWAVCVAPAGWSASCIMRAQVPSERRYVRKSSQSSLMRSRNHDPETTGMIHICMSARTMVPQASSLLREGPVGGSLQRTLVPIG